MKPKSFYLTALIALFATVSTPVLANFPILPTQQVLAQTTEARKAEADRLLQQGVQQYEAGNYEAALQPLQQALKIYREIGDRSAEAQSLVNLGLVYSSLNQYSKAQEFFSQAFTLISQFDITTESGLNLDSFEQLYSNFARLMSQSNNSSMPFSPNFLAQLTPPFELDRREQRAQEIVRLSQQGMQQINTRQFPAALQSFEQALTISREINSPILEAVSLSNIGEVYRSQGQARQGLEKHQQALKIWHQRVTISDPSDRQIEGRIINNMGGAYYSLGEYLQAQHFLEQALAIHQAIGFKLGQAESLNNLGGLYNSQGKYDRALDLVRQALAICREFKDPFKEATALNNLGLIYMNIGQYSQALESYYQANNIFKQFGLVEGEARILSNIGEVYRSQGQYSQALDFYHQANSVLQKIGDRAGMALVFNNLGAFYENLGQYEAAQINFQQALEISRVIGDRALEAVTLNNLGQNYVERSQYDQAVTLFEQALVIAKELGIRTVEAGTLNNLGIVHLYQGKYPQALEKFQQSLTIEKEVGNRSGEGTSLNNIAGVYFAQGAYTQALKFYQQALAITKELNEKAVEGQILGNMGIAFFRSGNLVSAEKTLRESVEVLKPLRSKLKDRDKVSIFDTQASLYRILQQVLIAQNKTNEALEISEAGRARAFVDLLGAKLASSDADVQPTINLAEIQQIARANHATIVEYSIIYDSFWLKLQKQELGLYIWVIKPTGEIAFRRSELKSLKTPLKDLVANTRDLIGGRSRGNTNQPAFAPGDRITLNDDIPNSPPWEVVSVNTQNATLTLRQPDWEKGTTIERSIADVASKTENLRTTDPRLQQLYQVLIQPIADLLPTDPNDRVIFIPQQELFLVPFPALQDAAGKYLIEQHTILTAPAIQVLELTHQQKSRVPGAAKDILVVGNPTMPKVSLVLGEPPQQLSPLPNAEREAQEIAQLLHAQPLIGARATKAAIVPQLPRARLIHLATHGILDDRRGLGSAIAFAPSGNDSGLLTAEEILDLKLNAELVVLSACNTGQGRITGDGVIGLSRSLISAGVPSVLVSLWSVPDAPTAFLMGEFYRHWQQQKLDKAQALRQAMLTTMQQHPHPKNWAAFTLIGEP